MTPPESRRQPGGHEGASASSPPTRLEKLTPRRPGKEQVLSEGDSEEDIEDYVPETDED